jgi:hypothetical protein
MNLDELPQAGAICPSCKETQEAMKKEPVTLVWIGDTEKGTNIPACAWCDGERIVEIAAAKNAASDDEADA